jgi:thiamine biosynthesis lipoprotein ApbE
LRTVFAISAVAKTGTASEGLSTTLLLLGPTKGKELLESMPDVSAVWISPTAQVETANGHPQILFGKHPLSPVNLGRN